MNGSVKRLSQDRPKPWRGRYRGPDGREHSKTFRTKAEAEKWLRTELASIDGGSWTDPTAGDVTFEKWSTAWLHGLDLKPSTKANYETNLRYRVLPTFETVSIARISPASVRAWLTSLRDKGLAPASVRQARTVLRSALEVAVVDGLLVRNPVDPVKAPRVDQRRQRFLTAPEVSALASACEDRQPGTGALIVLLAWSGLRWGEAVALQWGSVAGRRIRVKVSATEVGGKLIFGTPKTHQARTVVVPRFVIEALRERGEPDQLVFTAPRGGPLRNGNFRRGVWHPAVEVSGMPADLTMHDLRDTAASLMISSGASIKAVQRALGHASAKMTLDVYASLFEDDLEDLADRLESRYAAPGNVVSLR